MSNPQQLRYSKEHEWLSAAEDGVSTVGITEFAANALGDVVYVQLPEVGDTVTAGETCGELESTKSVSDLYSPVTGEVTEINEDVVDDPSLVNSAPFEGGWLFKVRVARGAEGPALRRRVRRLLRQLTTTRGTRLMSLLNTPLHELDPDVAAAVDAELHRQQSTLEMIASENFAPVAVMEAQGSVLTNKYAEGYPGRRYYGGCEHVDVVEQIAIDRIKELFGAEHANVQPHSGAQANAGRDVRAAQARRHDPGPGPRPRRAPDPRHEDQLLRQALQRGRRTTWTTPPARSTWPRSSGSPRSTGRS